MSCLSPGLICGLWLLAWTASAAAPGAPESPAVASASTTAVAALPEPIRTALAQSQLPADSLYLWIAPIDGGPARLSHQADQLAHPASLMKLVTSATALQRLGRGFQWRTGIHLDGPPQRGVLAGSLYIKGGGDPKLVPERLWLLLRQVRQLGIDEIRGDIVLDRSAYALPDIDPAAFDGEPLKPYNARPDALLVNYKSITLNFRPDPARGVAAVSAEPPLAGWTVSDSVRLSDAPCNDWRDGLRADFSSPQRWRFAGSYPLACGERNWPVAYNEPASYAARVIEAQWRALGGRLRGTVRDGRVPAGLPEATAFTSPPLTDVLRDMNMYSNNLIAQQLLLALGGQTPATLEAGRAPVFDLLGPVGCERAELRLDNGSGLSRDERITPRCLGRWLQWSWRQPWMPDLFASLPMAGEATARRAVSVSGRAHLKTGSLANVAAVAGVVHTGSGQRQAVIAILNHPQASRDAARQVLDAILRWTFEEKDTPP
jgi:D-alanyl-D-alanine carboxypeptidase/D-alanyl-D-alanine-endopeptidase (penicillin-binding protein 4)